MKHFHIYALEHKMRLCFSLSRDCKGLCTKKIEWCMHESQWEMQTRRMNERKTYSLMVLTKSIDKWDHLWASSIDNPLHSWRRHQWQPFIKMHSRK